MHWIIQNVAGDSVFAGTFAASKRISVTEYWALNKKRDEYTRRWSEQMWSEALGLDGIICPVQAIPQLPHGYVDVLSSDHHTRLNQYPFSAKWVRELLGSQR